MSKLFDALEKIQQQEPQQASSEPAKETAPVAKTGRYFPFLLGLTLITAVLAASHYYDLRQKKKKQAAPHPVARQSVVPGPSAMLPIAPPALAEAPAGNSQQKQSYYNEQGLSLAHKGDYWQAIYFFEQAIQLDPPQPEPAINMAVTLAHLGLQFPAQRYFSQAWQLAPGHQGLVQALNQAKERRQIEQNFLVQLSEGEAAQP